MACEATGGQSRRRKKKETQIKAKLFAWIFRSQCSGTSPNVRRGFSQTVIKLDVDDNLTRQDIRCGGLSASLRSTEIGAKSQQQISQSLAKWQPGQILSTILLIQPPPKKKKKTATLKCLKMCKQALTSARIQMQQSSPPSCVFYSSNR